MEEEKLLTVKDIVACGAASRLRLKQERSHAKGSKHQSRLWSGFSSEIETVHLPKAEQVKLMSPVERLLV